MKRRIMDHLKKLPEENTMAFISSHQLSEYYEEILRIHVTRFQASARVAIAAAKNPKMEKPPWYNHYSQHEYLVQLSFDVEDRQDQLEALLKIIQTLSQSIQRTARHFTNDEKNSLKAKMEALDVGYLAASSALYPDSKLNKRRLLNAGSETWWLVFNADPRIGINKMLTSEAGSSTIRPRVAALLVSIPASARHSTETQAACSPVSPSSSHSHR